MDINTSRGPQSRPQPMHTQQVTPSLSEKSSKRNKLPKNKFKFLQLILLYASMILIVALLFLIYQGGPDQTKYIDNSDFQAVFLNGQVSNGQIAYSTYFGKVVSINNQFLVLRDVYYITTNSSTTQSSSSTIQLTKLGCQQIDAPTDQMVINVSQVSFWENLQPTGQVSKAIVAYQKDNPNGPDCSQSTTSSTPTTSTQSPAAATTTNP